MYRWSLHHQLLSLRERAAFFLDELRITARTGHNKRNTSERTLKRRIRRKTMKLHFRLSSYCGSKRENTQMLVHLLLKDQADGRRSAAAVKAGKVLSRRLCPVSARPLPRTNAPRQSLTACTNSGARYNRKTATISLLSFLLRGEFPDEPIMCGSSPAKLQPGSSFYCLF